MPPIFQAVFGKTAMLFDNSVGSASPIPPGIPLRSVQIWRGIRSIARQIDVFASRFGDIYTV